MEEAVCGAGAYRGLPLGDVAAADGGGDDLDADLHGPRRGDLHVLHHQRLPRTPCHRRCAPPNTDESFGRNRETRTHSGANEQSSGGDGLVTSAGDDRRRGGRWCSGGHSLQICLAIFSPVQILVERSQSIFAPWFALVGGRLGRSLLPPTTIAPTRQH